MKIFIIVNLQVEGTHNWPECPIEEVSFLKHRHRHIFHITCKKEVSHNDRQIEIIRLKRQIEYHLRKSFGEGELSAEGCFFGRMSCEDIALHLLNKFNLYSCTVLEDNENGAQIISQ